MQDPNTDELYEAARKVVVDAGVASASYIQRKLGISYSDAFRMMDLLEKHGVISAINGSKPREVIGVPSHQIPDVHSKQRQAFFIIALAIVVSILVIWGSNSTANNQNVSSLNTSQIACKSSAAKAFEEFIHPANGEAIPKMVGMNIDEQSETVESNYKFNYDANSNLCFVEYIISVTAQTSDTHETIQQYVKTIGALTNEAAIHYILAGFLETLYPTGSKQILTCYASTPGHAYDNHDPTKMTYNELFHPYIPTQCNSEADFDTLVSQRFGIQ